MAKKIFIHILIALMISPLLLLGCKSDGADEYSDETQDVEESVLQESKEINHTGEESGIETEKAITDSKEEAEEVEEDLSAEEGEITFITEDDIELNGNIFGSGNKWVILSHMYPTDQTSWFEFAEMLKKNNYIVLTYDFRGYGKSGGSLDVSRLDIDLTAAIAYIRQYDPESIHLMGGSMGGTASLFIASKERIDGVISFSSPDEFEGISAISVIGDITAAKLFIASRGDEAAARSATEMYEKSTEPKTLEILEGNSHGTFIFEEEPDNAEKIKEIVLNFLY